MSLVLTGDVTPTRRGSSAAGRRLSSVVQPHIADDLRWPGYDLMGAARNHTLDYGPVATCPAIASVGCRAILAFTLIDQA